MVAIAGHRVDRIIAAIINGDSKFHGAVTPLTVGNRVLVNTSRSDSFAATRQLKTITTGDEKGRTGGLVDCEVDGDDAVTTLAIGNRIFVSPAIGKSWTTTGRLVGLASLNIYGIKRRRARRPRFRDWRTIM